MYSRYCLIAWYRQGRKGTGINGQNHSLLDYCEIANSRPPVNWDLRAIARLPQLFPIVLSTEVSARFQHAVADNWPWLMAKARGRPSQGEERGLSFMFSGKRKVNPSANNGNFCLYFVKLGFRYFNKILPKLSVLLFRKLILWVE